MEFKRLSDVILVEEATETANVLIEEGGEIKRVPKTEVGGAGNGEYDAVIEYVDTDDEYRLELISGGYQTICDKIQSGEEPKIKVLSRKYNYGDYYSVNSTNLDIYLYCDGEPSWVVVGFHTYPNNAYTQIVLRPDNSIE